MFLTVPAKPSNAETDELMKDLEKSIRDANKNAKKGVKTYVEQEANNSQILINTLRMRCGTDMCLSRDLALSRDFTCNSMPVSQCTADNSAGKCAPSEGRGCTDKCTYVTEGGVDSGCASKGNYRACAVHSRGSTKGGCRWKNNACVGVKPAVNEAGCDANDKCVWAQVTKGGFTKGTCISDFRKTARRGCFAKCAHEGVKEDYDCIRFETKTEKNVCPAGFRELKNSDSREMAMCRKWYKETVITDDMARALVESYDCAGDDCPPAPVSSAEKTEVTCRTKVCVNDEQSGYASVTHPVFEQDGACAEHASRTDCLKYSKKSKSGGCRWYKDKCRARSKVRGCPEIEGVQYWPFAVRPSPYAFDQGMCDTVCAKHKDMEGCDGGGCQWDDASGTCSANLEFSGNLMIAGQGDKGLCVLRNINQSNQIKQAQEVMSASLNAVDLRTIRNSMTDIGKNVTQEGFSWGQYTSVQNVSKSLTRAARDIRQKASQTCGGTQMLRNEFGKTCKNMAQNGRALPCIMDETNQKNQASAASSCLQQVMMDSKAIEKTVLDVKTRATNLKNGITLPNVPIIGDKIRHQPRKWAITINIAILLFSAIVVSIASIVFFAQVHKGRNARRGMACAGYAGFFVGLLLGGIGFLLGGGKGVLPKHLRQKYPDTDFFTYVGVKNIPVEGRKKEVRDTIAGVVGACQSDPGCAAWAFKSVDDDGAKRAPELCGVPDCDLKKCTENKTCDECCPKNCLTMVSDGALQTDKEAVARCKAGKSKDKCEKPCMWVGQKENGQDDPGAFCTYAPSVWGKADATKTPDRLWCMTCKAKKGLGTLYTHLNPKDPNDFDVDTGKPLMTSLTASELACFHLAENTLGVKMVPNKPWEKDAEDMFVEGVAVFGIGMILLIVSMFVQRGGSAPAAKP